MPIISENDQGLLDELHALERRVGPRLFGPDAAKLSEAELVAIYREFMIEVAEWIHPKDATLNPAASFVPAQPLRDGLTAGIAAPKAGAGPFPVLMHAHGHGLRAGDPPEFEPWMREMASYGFVVIFPDYRWQPEASFEDQIDDMFFAIRWARENAKALNIDPDRMVLGGDSMGGALAFEVLMRSLEQSDGQRFKAFLGVDSFLKIPERSFGSAARASDPVSRITAETPLPPIYFLVGSGDRAALGLAQTALKLMELQKGVQMDLVLGMPHDFAKIPHMEAGRPANRRAMEFLLSAV